MALIPSVTSVTSIGYLFLNPSSSLVRPANTTAYASGDLVANSTVAGSVLPLLLVASRTDAGSVLVERVKVHKTGVSISGASFRVHMFSVAPVPTVGDNAVFATSGASGYLGSADVVIGQVFTDGASGFSDTTVKPIRARLDSGYTIYALIEARGAYTPVSAETFTVTLDVVQG